MMSSRVATTVLIATVARLDRRVLTRPDRERSLPAHRLALDPARERQLQPATVTGRGLPSDARCAPSSRSDVSGLCPL
jgi:hypothetical protein